MKKDNELLTLFFIFLRIGAFTFGGGYAMLPIVYNELCEKRDIASTEEMNKIVVISQSLPGVLAVNCATQVGYRRHGLWGAFVCALGITLPSLIIIMLLANVIMKYRNNLYVMSMFFMIRAAVVGLIVGAAFKMAKTGRYTVFQFIMMGLSVLFMWLSLFNPIFLIICGGLVGLLVTERRQRAQ